MDLRVEGTAKVEDLEVSLQFGSELSPGKPKPC